MATKKISELEAINAAEDNDVLVIVDTSESTTNKITKGNLLIGAGHTIEMTLNENYQIVLVLKNAAGTALSTQTIDLPNENAVTNLAYNNGILTVTKQSGATSQINLTGLIEGLVTENDFNTFKEALQTTLEAINEKDAEQDEAIAENYKVINKLNEKLENQQKVIDQLPQVEGQGTSITLENTIEAPFTKFDVEGNSTQETTEGKNLLPYPYTAETKTMNGVTFKVNEDGTVIANGTATANSYFLLKGTIALNGTYTISTGLGVSESTYMALLDENDKWIDKLTTKVANKVTATVNSNFQAYIYVSQGVTANNVVFKPMIRLSTITDDTYEKYTGGQATPNPNYEQPIKSAGENGSINEKIQNKNKMTYPLDFEITNNGIRSKQAKGTYNLNGTTTSSGNFLVQQNFIKSIKIQSGDYLHIMNSSANSNVAMILCFSDGSIDSAGLITANRIYDLSNSVGKTLVGIRFYCNSANINISINLTPMIINNSTATPYVPHKEQDYSIFVQQPFRSIGDIRDVFFKNTVDSPYYDENLTLNGWYERHYFSKIEQLLDLVGPVAQGFYFIPPGIKKGAKLLSTHQQLGTKAESEEWQRFDGSQMKQLYPTAHNGVYINYKADTKQEQIDWWNSLNNILLYELEIPLNLPCTSEQVEQLENKPSTYKDFTIINSEDETEAYLEVAGIRDINTMFDKVTNAIVSLGGNV